MTRPKLPPHASPKFGRTWPFPDKDFESTELRFLSWSWMLVINGSRSQSVFCLIIVSAAGESTPPTPPTLLPSMLFFDYGCKLVECAKHACGCVCFCCFFFLNHPRWALSGTPRVSQITLPMWRAGLGAPATAGRHAALTLYWIHDLSHPIHEAPSPSLASGQITARSTETRARVLQRDTRFKHEFCCLATNFKTQLQGSKIGFSNAWSSCSQGSLTLPWLHFCTSHDCASFPIWHGKPERAKGLIANWLAC